jgi:hypothetical protein
MASSNDGVVSREAAATAGTSSQQLHRWIKAGRLDAIGHNAIVFPGGLSTFRRQLRTALINDGSDAVASHRSAAYLLGFDGFGEVDPEVMVPRAQRGRQSGPGVVHSTSTLTRADRTVLDTFPCTTAARTIIDLSGCCDRNDLESAIDSAVRNGQMSVDYLRRRLSAVRHRGRDGAARS